MRAAGRYLTPAEKALTLESWLTGQVDAPYADEGVHPLMARLNAIEGVCTVQSCIGHVRESRADGSRYVESGHIEMRLDERATARFYAGLGALVALPGREDALISWRPGYQVCTVWFQPGRMAQFVDALVAILAPSSTTRDEGARSDEVPSCL